MIKDFVIVFVLWLSVRFLWLVDTLDLYNTLVGFCAESQTSILGTALLGAMGVVLAAYLLSSLQLFTPLYLLSRLTFEVSQFVIVLFSCAAVIFLFDGGFNLWQGVGLLEALIPFLFLGVSCFGFWLFDFNYPLQQRLVRNILLPLLSGVIVLVTPYFL